jgi:serine protease Do
MGLDQPGGALVATVMGDGPAEGKLKSGDVIMEFNGAKVGGSRDLPKLVGATRAGSEVAVEILREGERKTVTVEVGALKAEKHAAAGAAAMDSASEKLGASLAALSPQARSQLGLDDAVEGAVVTALDGGGAAAAAGLRVGDVIVQVGSRKVADPAELDRALGEVQTPSALLLINRNGDQVFVGVKLNA